jgi:hypothetical protein
MEAKRIPKAVIAALLHDAIEDQEVPRELIAREFGEDVAALVEEVSDAKQLEKHHRKRIQIDTAHKKSDDAKRIKLADKTSFARDYLQSSTRLVFWNGSLPPIGCRIVDCEQRGHRIKKTLEIDPFQAETVRLIFRLAREGDGATGPMGTDREIERSPSSSPAARHRARPQPRL